MKPTLGETSESPRVLKQTQLAELTGVVSHFSSAIEEGQDEHLVLLRLLLGRCIPFNSAAQATRIAYTHRQKRISRRHTRSIHK
jgi:hypothetical protein